MEESGVPWSGLLASWLWSRPEDERLRCDTEEFLQCRKLRFILRTGRRAAASSTLCAIWDCEAKSGAMVPSGGKRTRLFLHMLACGMDGRARSVHAAGSLHLSHTLYKRRSFGAMLEVMWQQTQRVQIFSSWPKLDQSHLLLPNLPPPTSSWFYPCKATLALIPSDLYKLAKNQISDLHAWANLLAMRRKELLSPILLEWNSYIFLSQLLSLITFISIQPAMECW